MANDPNCDTNAPPFASGGAFGTKGGHELRYLHKREKLEILISRDLTRDKLLSILVMSKILLSGRSFGEVKETGQCW